jgi:membrane-associated phospholipid phosphatase
MSPKILLLLAALVSVSASAQSTPDLTILRGLAPVTVLEATPEGKAALDANYKVTGGIQTGTLHQPTLLPFPEQQQMSLQDATETIGNLAQLSDGLGTTLSAAYQARAHYLDPKTFTSISPAIANLIAYATALSSTHATAGKYLFGNATTDNHTPVAPDILDILKDIHGETDIFGKAYHLPAGAPPKADPYGDSRPFQTEPSLAPIVGPDYFNVLSNNTLYTSGPAQDLTKSPSYPSGHTTYGYTGSLLLAILVPERYQQMVARGAEYGNDRIIVGAHYAMDVLGGRTLALYDVAHLLANDPAYLNRSPKKDVAPIADFQAAVKTAHTQLADTLQAICGDTVQTCAHQDIGRFSRPAANEAFYADTQTYHLGVVYPQQTGTVEDVAKLAPEAGYLLTAAFPSLTLRQADQILTDTEGPGGGFLDRPGSPLAVYSRLNLYVAAGRAAALASSQPAKQ